MQILEAKQTASARILQHLGLQEYIVPQCRGLTDTVGKQEQHWGYKFNHALLLLMV